MKPGLKGGSKRQIRVSFERARFSLAAAARSSAIFLLVRLCVARPRNDMEIAVSESSSRSFTLGSLGSGRCPILLPEGMTKETNHSLLLSDLLAAMTGAVIAIGVWLLFPLEM